MLSVAWPALLDRDDGMEPELEAEVVSVAFPLDVDAGAAVVVSAPAADSDVDTRSMTAWELPAPTARVAVVPDAAADDMFATRAIVDATFG